MKHFVFVLAAACHAGSSASQGDAGDDAADAMVALDAAGDGAIVPHGYIGAYASPSIVRVGDTYHAFFAGDRFSGQHYNIPHATFTEDGNWTFVGEALPHLGTGAYDGPGYPVWAPGVAQISATHWMLFYTAQLSGTPDKKCIFRAHATSPDGPFVDDYGGPIVCPPDTLWAIDPYPVKDTHGVWGLAARVDEPGGINTIQLRALNAAAENFATGSSWSVLTQNQPTSWEQPVLENAGVVHLYPPTQPTHWFVFYSAGAWANNSYAIGYADCGDSFVGPCTKKTPNGPWLGTNAAAGVFGPGTPTLYDRPDGTQLMSVQAWQFSGGTSNSHNSKGQIMRTYALEVDDHYVPTSTLVRVDTH
jgi:hypothetical protein